MKKVLSFIMVAAMVNSVITADDKLYVNGSTGQKINGKACPGWTIANPLDIPLENGV